MDSWATLRNRVYTAFEPTLYRGGMLDSTMGRTISRRYAQDLAIGEQVAAAVAPLAQISPPADAAVPVVPAVPAVREPRVSGT